LRALGIDLDETAGGQPTIDPGTAARRLASAKFADALHHINAREAIGFTYHKPGQPARKVRLEPYALLSRRPRLPLRIRPRPAGQTHFPALPRRGCDLQTRRTRTR